MMSNQSNPHWDDPVEDEGEEAVSDVEWGGRDGMIFLIDATEAMFKKEENSDANFRTALKCCYMTMMQKIQYSVKDLIGVVLFGTSKTENSLNANHLIVLQKLEQPNIEKIKSLDAMIKSETFDSFKEKYGFSNDYILQDALWLCQFMFSECDQKMGMQRILMFTGNDEPHRDNSIEQQRALDRANDLHGLNITLELLPLGSNFNTGFFYKDLVEAAMGEEYAQQMLPNCSQKLEELLKRTCRYSHKKRSQGRVLLYLGPELAIGVAVYSMLRERSLPKRVWLESSTNMPAQPVTHNFNADTGEKVLAMDIMKSKTVGGQKVIFKPEETKDTKLLLEVGFYLMGFKPQERIKLQHHYKKPYFLFPDDKQVKGSRKLFAALLKRCSDRDKVAICWGVLRRGTSPHLYALFPQPEIINPKSGVQEVAGGFHAYCLPFSENIRPLSFDKMKSATPEQVDVVNQVVSKLTFPFDVHNFQNPRLQTLWASIEALALGLESARVIEDHTKPNKTLIEEKLAEIGVDFNEVFHLGNKDVKPVSTKREVEVGGNSDSKKIKLDPDDVAVVMEFARLKKVDKLKVDQLRTYLMSKDQKVAGLRKAELVKLVYQVYNAL